MSHASAQQPIDSIMAISPVIPVIRIDSESSIEPLGDALMNGGVSIAEVTLRTPLGLKAIRQLNDSHPELCVGAGTVLNRHDFDAAVEAGSRFIVSPGATDELYATARDAGVPFLPGVATAGECMTALDHGLSHLKFFPANASGGIDWLKAIGAALSGLSFCPTGGIGLHNAAQYLALSNVRCVGGSWIVPSDALLAGDRDRITALCQQAVTALTST